MWAFMRPVIRRYRTLLAVIQLITCATLVAVCVLYATLGPLDADLLLRERFQVIINTIDCSREFPHMCPVLAGLNIQVQNDSSCDGYLGSYLKSHIGATDSTSTEKDSNVFLNDISSGISSDVPLDIPFDIPLNFRTQRPGFEMDPTSNDRDLLYRNKYIESLLQCRRSGKMLCLILEDDVVFINKPYIAKLRLAWNTLSYYTNDLDVFDCSKWGLPGVHTGPTGNKSVCRIVPNNERLDCIIDIMTNRPYPADIGLNFASIMCGMKQKRFLLVQHAGGKSTLGHGNG